MTGMQFTPGRNCWQVATADRMAMIVDGKDYFRTLRGALLKAQRLAMMVGWDFDFEIEMLPGESDDDGIAPDGFPNRIGEFLNALVEQRPELDIYLLKWSGGALIAPGRMLPAMHIKLLSPDQIHLAFDGRHPIGACHHQKIVTIDDSLAFCGGIDVTDGRWDDRDHDSHNPLRRLKNGDISQPWHDASAMLTGPAAQELAKLARRRWQRATEETLDEEFSVDRDLWPDDMRPAFRDIPVAIARTEPPEADTPLINEIERLYLDAIGAARRHIYIESQYFCSDSITRAIARRLAEPDGPEILVVTPVAAQKQVEDLAMHVTRSRMMRHLRARDPHRRFRIVSPVTSTGDPIYVHAKVMVVDDWLLRVGSSNIDRRSMGFDTECDVAIIGDAAQTRDNIVRFRNGLLAEHMGCSAERVDDAMTRTGSLLGTLDALNRPNGRGLRPLKPRRESWLGSFLADTRLFDPRYRKSAQARVGVTSRHLTIGAAVLVAAAGLAWHRHRRRTPRDRPPGG